MLCMIFATIFLKLVSYRMPISKHRFLDHVLYFLLFVGLGYKWICDFRCLLLLTVCLWKKMQKVPFLDGFVRFCSCLVHSFLAPYWSGNLYVNSKGYKLKSCLADNNNEHFIPMTIVMIIAGKQICSIICCIPSFWILVPGAQQSLFAWYPYACECQIII